MKSNRTKKLFIGSIVALLLLSGCSFTEVGQKLDELFGKAEDKYLKEEGGKDKSWYQFGKEKSGEMSKKFSKDLSEFEMKEIDNWLSKNGLNEYGDPEGTNYAGGTPLFDELTGKAKDRYDHILENHPELFQFLELPEPDPYLLDPLGTEAKREENRN